jgi:hypothetical protein
LVNVVPVLTDPETYRDQIDTVFRVNHDAGLVPLRLVEIADSPLGDGRQFSLIFHGPVTAAVPQGTYAFEHDALGALALFIVPIVGSNHERIVYQACFNLMPPAPTSERGGQA